MPATPKPLPANVLAALRAGSKLEAVKLLCEATGLGLKESKDAIDEYDGRNPSHAVTASSTSPLPEPVVEALRRGNKLEAIKLLGETTGLGLQEAKDWIDSSSQEVQSKVGTGAPGEVSRPSNLIWYVVAAQAVTALIAYWVMRSPGV